MIFKKVTNNCIHALMMNKTFGKDLVIFLADFKEDVTDKISFKFTNSKIVKIDVAEHIIIKLFHFIYWQIGIINAFDHLHTKYGRDIQYT
jgi:hypothetical protein